MLWILAKTEQSSSDMLACLIIDIILKLNVQANKRLRFYVNEQRKVSV